MFFEGFFRPFPEFSIMLLYNLSVMLSFMIIEISYLCLPCKLLEAKGHFFISGIFHSSHIVG